MNRNSVEVTTLIFATVLVMTAMLAQGGSLAPGTSPSHPTASMLIDQPGFYYLTDHVTGEVGKAGIAITASDVTVDLNGSHSAACRALATPPTARSTWNWGRSSP